MIETEINPHVEQWEKEQIFPAKEVFKAFGQAGLLGINKPVDYGGLGLDYKYQLAFLESTGHIRSAGILPFNILSGISSKWSKTILITTCVGGTRGAPPGGPSYF